MSAVSLANLHLLGGRCHTVLSLSAKSVVGEKTIVCGKSARWWDEI